MSNAPVEKIVIVGGGTSGWMSAAFLSSLLGATSNGDRKVNITLIESPKTNRIGVGESTVPSLRNTMSYMNVSEEDWMQKCNATFKLGIKFENWSHANSLDSNNFFWHPFEDIQSTGGVGLEYFWLKRKILENKEPLAYACALAPSLCDQKKSPKTQNGESTLANYGYAYHLDSTLFSDYLEKLSIQRGVVHIVDHVKDVSLRKDGCIDFLSTEANGDIHGDLFIDCTGFQRLLIQKALNETFISFSDCLICDSAVALQIPYDSTKGRVIEPFTTSTALKSGWKWDVPLRDRRGVGYVFSRQFISWDQAETELRESVGFKEQDIAVKRVKFEPGRMNNIWVKNCLAIGLASGFVEPLEATGIYLVEAALKSLIDYFPDKSFEPKTLEKYNSTMATLYSNIRDFITLHYCLTKRDDTSFWSHNRYGLTIPDSLASRLDLWSRFLPSANDLDAGLLLFDERSYLYILAGMDYLPEQGVPILNLLDDTAGKKAFLSVKNQIKLASRLLPAHSF